MAPQAAGTGALEEGGHLASIDRARVGAAGDQLVSISNPNSALAGIYATVSAFGNLNVSIDPNLLFSDTFENGSIVDTTNRWASAGTVPPTQAVGVLSVNPGATASATSVLTSQPSFLASTTIVIAATIAFETGTTALGNHRFYGIGTASGVGTAAAPLQEGAGFEIDTAGVLRASVYALGSRVFTQVLSMSTDGVQHRYVIVVRGDLVLWFKDTFDIPLCSTFIGPSLQTLPLRLASLNSGAVTGTPTMTTPSVAVLDQARTAQALSDGTYWWRRALIDAAGNQAVKGNYAEQAALTAGSLNADLVASVDVSAYKSFSIGINATAFVGTLSFQCSNDNITFTPLEMTNQASGANATNVTTASNLFAAMISFRWLRIRMTAYTSGAAGAVLELYTSALGSLGLFATQSGTWTVMPGNTVNTSPWFANAIGITGGAANFHLISAASTNATSIKATAGQVYGYELYNGNAAVRFVKLFNKATAPTVGTDVPLRTVGVPPASRVTGTFPNGLTLASGIALATTTGIADLDVGAVGASDLSIDIDYK